MRLLDLDEKIRTAKDKAKDLANDMDVTEKALSGWRNGKSYPRGKNLLFLLNRYGPLKAKTEGGDIILLSPENAANPPSTPSPEGGKKQKPRPVMKDRHKRKAA